MEFGFVYALLLKGREKTFALSNPENWILMAIAAVSNPQGHEPSWKRLSVCLSAGMSVKVVTLFKKLTLPADHT